MEAHARADRPDAVRRTYLLLERRLAEIDADPDDATLDAVRRAARLGDCLIPAGVDKSWSEGRVTRQIV
jgi:hypothetical protein